MLRNRWKVHAFDYPCLTGAHFYSRDFPDNCDDLSVNLRNLPRLGHLQPETKKGPQVGDLCSRREGGFKKPVLNHAALDSNFLFSFCSI
jgi:hypothetical protein